MLANENAKVFSTQQRNSILCLYNLSLCLGIFEEKSSLKLQKRLVVLIGVLEAKANDRIYWKDWPGLDLSHRYHEDAAS